MSSKLKVDSRVVSNVVATKLHTDIMTNIIGESPKRKCQVMWDGIGEFGPVSSLTIKICTPGPEIAAPAPAAGGGQTTALVENGEQVQEEDMVE